MENINDPRFDHEWDNLRKNEICPKCKGYKSGKGFIGGCICKEEPQSVLLVDIDSKEE